MKNSLFLVLALFLISPALSAMDYLEVLRKYERSVGTFQYAQLHGVVKLNEGTPSEIVVKENPSRKTYVLGLLNPAGAYLWATPIELHFDRSAMITGEKEILLLWERDGKKILLQFDADGTQTKRPYLDEISNPGVFTWHSDGFILRGEGRWNTRSGIVKLDADGKILWHAPIGGTSHRRVSSILPLSDGDFIFVGDFGFKSPGTTAVFELEDGTKQTLALKSGDDDLAGDLFIGRISRDGKYQWVQPIWAYASGSRRHHLSVDLKGAISHFFTWDGYDAVVNPLGKTPIKIRHNGIGAVAVFSDKGQILDAKQISSWPANWRKF